MLWIFGFPWGDNKPNTEETKDRWSALLPPIIIRTQFGSIVTSNQCLQYKAFKVMMNEGFEVVTFHDEISQFYGASIVRDRSKRTLKVAQSAYARDIVETFLPEDAPIADTPSRSSNLSTTSDLSPGSVDLMRRIVGKLTFLTRTLYASRHSILCQ